MEGSLLPEGSGGEEPPADPKRSAPRGVDIQAEMWYHRKVRAFERVLEGRTPRGTRRRKAFSEYTARNCEEAYGEGAGKAHDRVG